MTPTFSHISLVRHIVRTLHRQPVVALAVVNESYISISYDRVEQHAAIHIQTERNCLQYCCKCELNVFAPQTQASVCAGEHKIAAKNTQLGAMRSMVKQLRAVHNNSQQLHLQNNILHMD